MLAERRAGIDTVYLWTTERMNPDLLPDKTTHIKDGKEHFTGHLENLKVSTGPSGTSLRGSLSRYFFGSNAFSLPKEKTWQAFSKLCRATGLDLLEDSKLTRLDLAIDIITDYPAWEYLHSFGPSSRFKDVADYKGKGWLYKQLSNGEGKGRQLAIYDKGKEATETKKAIPEGLDPERLLRIEGRLFKPSEALGIKPLYPCHLLLPEVMDRIKETVIADLKSIQMLSKPLIDPSKLERPKALDELLQAFGLESIGPEKVEMTIRAMQSAGKINASQASRMRTKYKALAKHYARPEGSILPDELYKKAG